MLFGIYTLWRIAITQDITALSRARDAAANRLITAGIPRERIDAGFEYDYETQLESVGHINDPRIRIPADAFKKNLGPTYKVQALYRLEFSPTAITTPSSFRIGRIHFVRVSFPPHDLHRQNLTIRGGWTPAGPRRILRISGISLCRRTMMIRVTSR